MRPFRDLKVWEKSHHLTLEIYRLTKTFPHDEKFGLTSQLRRAAASIPANIAEGCGRGSDADFRRFLLISAGSASEVEYHILLARDLGYIDEVSYGTTNNKVTEINRMLSAFIQKLGG